MGYYDNSRINTRPDAMIILRNWSFVFIEGTDRGIRDSVNECVVRFKKESGFGKTTIKFLGSFCIVGEVYGSNDYPSGHRITTHIIKSVSKITDPRIIERIKRRNDDVVLLAQTVRGEEYYICLGIDGDIAGGNY